MRGHRVLDERLVTVNVDLDWEPYVAALRPHGKPHFVGATSSVSSAVSPLITGEKSIGGSPVGSPATLAEMLAFAARHGIAPLTEHLPMSKVNDAMERL